MVLFYWNDFNSSYAKMQNKILFTLSSMKHLVTLIVLEMMEFSVIFYPGSGGEIDQQLWESIRKPIQSI